MTTYDRSDHRITRQQKLDDPSKQPEIPRLSNSRDRSSYDEQRDKLRPASLKSTSAQSASAEETLEHHRFDLSIPEERRDANIILLEANLEPGENWVNETIDGKSYQQLVSNKLPESGILELDYRPAKNRLSYDSEDQPEIRPKEAGTVEYVKIEGEPFIQGEDDELDIAFNDIDQGSLGDCYLLAALSSIALNDPESIRKMIKPLGAGLYAVTFYDKDDDGKLVAQMPVLVDDTFPASSSGTPKYAREGDRSEAGSELWVMLIEKAWAMSIRAEKVGTEKETIANSQIETDTDGAITGTPGAFYVTLTWLSEGEEEPLSVTKVTDNSEDSELAFTHLEDTAIVWFTQAVTGSVLVEYSHTRRGYNAAQSGRPGWAMERLTGQTTETTKSIDEMSDEDILEAISEALAEKHPVTASTLSGDKQSEEQADLVDNLNLFSSHAYTVVSVDGTRIQLYNPHGGNHPGEEGFVEVNDFKSVFYRYEINAI